MNLTEITLKNNRIAIIVLLLVSIVGISNYFDLSRDSMPPYTIRIASVVTRFPGASPAEVESLVTEKLEEAIREMAEVKSIESESRTGLSVITVQLKDNVSGDELQPVWDELKDKMNEVKPTLPKNIVGPIVKDKDIGTVFGIILGVESDGVPYNVLEDYAKEIRDKLLLLPDAAKVKYGGVQEERIIVAFDDQQLSRYGLNVKRLAGIISSTNILYPAGVVNVGKKRIILEPTGSYQSIEDLKKTLIPTGTGSTIFLGDIANIYSDYIHPKENIVRVNGKNAIALFISLKKGANIVRLGKEVDKIIPQINRTLPLGVELVRIASQDHIVNKQVNNFLISLLQSVIIVLTVMLFFLGFRTGSLVATLVPMVILSTFFFMHLFDLGLNKVSLAALIISLGLFVDNGIVMAEQILVRVQSGQSTFKAAVDSCRMLMIPLLISTLTTSAAFLSFALAETPMGEMASPLFSVVSISLLSSWFLTFTFVPLLALIMFKIKMKEKKGSFVDRMMSRINAWYNKLLVRVLTKAQVPFVILIFVLFILSIILMPFLPFKLVPDSDRNLVTVDVIFPTGTKIEITDAAVAKIEKYIQDSLIVSKNRSRGVLDYSSFIGEGPEPYDLGYFKNEAISSYAHMLLNTTGDLDNDYVIRKLDKYCFNNFPDADIRVNRLTGAGASGTPVEIRISGKNPEKLAAIAKAVKEKLVQIPGTKNITDDWGPKIKKLTVKINEDKAQRAGLTNMDIAMALNAGLSGFKVDNFREKDKSIPIYVKAKNSDKYDIEKIESYNIFSPVTRKNVQLSHVAKVVVDWQFAKIIRKDLKRTTTVGSYLESGYSAKDIFKSIEGWLNEQKISWGTGYNYSFGGEDEDKNENLGAIVDWLPLSFGIILILLVLQFNSIRKSLIVYSTIPLGVIGVVIGWYIGGTFVSFFGILGIIALAGIVINNAIILIDRIGGEKEENPELSEQDAIIKAANHKFRPVILTTLTTSLGMLPLLISGGLLWQPLSLAIIFGLTFGTVIILLYVPVVYALLFKVKFDDYQYDKAKIEE
ncbi:efflux RND transporter permease subunit [Candidatus Sulfidibacterium hydrothermale]|uniref:efflux RND transporter permease subunit n=1 Tax=Candidatus Sulfidibacterium hydrothermale TaxID=2875962 RepID=UPI001F0B12F0|nr:efflux RND transporter permease subunit [Candidatus Sulfidibacterium hydrothermale]UBM62707.1 efflux RND transporter permease subunit [Candidatus Sulfidibacterium hydrothermale]